MRKQIAIITLGILMLVTAVATTIYSGESYNITLPEQYEHYSIIGNLTPIDLGVAQDGLTVTIIINKYQQEDRFTLIFFNNESEPITEYVYTRGGSSTRTIYVDQNITKYVDRDKIIYRDRNITDVVPDDDKLVGIEEPTGFFSRNVIIIISLIGGVILAIFLYFLLREDEEEEIEAKEEEEADPFEDMEQV